MTKHLFLTGVKGVGKSTLVQTLLGQYPGTLGGFYTYTETSDGYLRLTAIDTDGYTEYVVDEDSYVKDTDLDEIKNGILVWTDA